MRRIATTAVVKQPNAFLAKLKNKNTHANTATGLYMNKHEEAPVQFSGTYDVDSDHFQAVYMPGSFAHSGQAGQKAQERLETGKVKALPVLLRIGESLAHTVKANDYSAVHELRMPVDGIVSRLNWAETHDQFYSEEMLPVETAINQAIELETDLYIHCTFGEIRSPSLANALMRYGFRPANMTCSNWNGVWHGLNGYFLWLKTNNRIKKRDNHESVD